MMEERDGFKVGLESLDFVSPIGEKLTVMCKSIVENREKIIVDFLKLHGYRPKNTKEYAKNLKYSLHRKGLELASEITQHPFDEKNLTYSETFRVFFRPFTKRKYTKGSK